MKTIFLTLSLTFMFNIACFSQFNYTTFPIMYLNGESYTSGTYSYANTGNFIIAPNFSGTQTDNISGTANVTYTSGTEIILTDGFTAGDFTGNGSFTAQIATSSQDIYACIISPTPESDGYKYEMFEFGVKLPSSPIDYAAQIDAFLAAPTWNGGSNPTTTGIDPYDFKQIKVEAVFTSPSGVSYTRYGFFFQWVFGTNSGTTFSTPADDPYSYLFRVRFAPPETGKWNVSFSFYQGTTQIGQPFQGFFNVAHDYGYPGKLSIGNYEHLRFDNGSGFFGIGQNIAIAEVEHGNVQPNDNDYSAQRSYIDDLSANGGNFVRIRMDPWSNGLEWGIPTLAPTSPPVVCDYQQASAMEFDNTLARCEADNVYAMVTLLDDQVYGLFDGWSSNQWVWNGTGGYSNPYFYLLGGFNTNPTSEEFFTDNRAITAFQNYLFYVQARWGYSPNIAIWELVNETDKLGCYSSSGTLYGDLPAYRSEVGSWVGAMKSLLNTSDMYPYHLLTTGYTSAGPGSGDISAAYLDVAENHQYNNDVDANKTRYNNLERSSATPFFYGEVGPDLGPSDCDLSACCDQLPEGSRPEGGEDISFHNAAWATAFMNTMSIGLNWLDWAETCGTTCSSNCGTQHRLYNFPYLKIFFSTIDLQNNCFEPDFDEFSDVFDGTTIEMYSMENCSGTYDTYKIGWFHNQSMDWETSGESCITSCTPSSGITYATSISGGSPSVTFSNLAPYSNYQLNVYNPYTSNPVSAWTFSFQTALTFLPCTQDINIPLSNETYYLVDGQTEPDYAFTLRCTSGRGPVKHDSDMAVTNLPNDTVYLPMDSIRFPICYQSDKKGHNAWDFDDGITSSLPNPKFKFNTPGNYLVTLIHSDSSNKPDIKVDQIYIVIRLKNNNDLTDNSTFCIIPNPTTGEFTGSFNDGRDIDEITISDVLGNVVFTAYSPKIYQFNISNFASGMYLIKVKSGVNIYRTKIVKY